MIDAILGRTAAGEDLSADDMDAAVDGIMQGRWTEPQIATLLTALRAKGETADEVVGAVRAMRRWMTPIRTRRHRLVDTCGTGGDRSGTFNISTAAALVAAAAGVSVAKHGNRGFSSSTGSADVLAELGVNIQAETSRVEACLDELGIGFCFAPACHPAMKHAAPVRKKLGVPTIFNLLGPLANPASAAYQLIGVGRPELRGLLAAALTRLDVGRAVVVHGDDGLDEVTLSGPTQATETTAQGTRDFVLTPEDFGLSRADDLDALVVEGPAESAAVIRGVLAGQPGPARDIVVMNAAVAIALAGDDRLDDPAALQAAAARAGEAIDSRAAARLLERLAQRSGS